MVFSYSRTSSTGFSRCASRPIAVRELGEREHDFEIAFDQRANARANDFDDDFLAVLELRGVHLRDRRGGQRLLVEFARMLRSTGRP